MKIPFAVGYEQSRDKASSSSILVNCFAEPQSEWSKNAFSIYGTSGFEEWVDLDSNNPIWGMHVLNNELYVVCGDLLYKVSTTGIKTTIGSIGVNPGRVYMEDNRVQVSILKLTGEQYVTDGVTVAPVTAPAYMSASAMTYADGYGVFSKMDSDVWFLSDLLDFEAYDALDFATASEKSDILVRPYFFNNGLWLFGSETIEVWSNTGAQNFPFEQIPGAVKTSRGCGASFSLAQEDNTIFWLGNDRIIWKAAGFDPAKISNFAVDNRISQMTKVDDAFGFVYTEAGHKFYVITFPFEQVTFAYDIGTQLWHYKESFNAGRWRANAFAAFDGMNLIGDFQSSKIFRLDPEIYTEDGVTIQRTLQTQPLWNETNRMTIDSLQLDINTGVGITAGQGSDPIVWMQYSDDGCNTWTSERFGYMGRIGEYYRRVIWRRLGMSRQRVFRFRISDPVKFVVSGLYATLRGGKS